MNRCDSDSLSANKFYKTYQEALKEGAVQRGWIPDFVPEDAYDIADWHSLSPEEQTLSFKFSDPKAFKRKIHAYKKVDEKLGELRPKKISKDHVRWLPKATAFEPTGFYHMPDFYQTACLMIDWSTQKAYFSSHCIKETLAK